jgi:hypothetical protein
MGMAVIFSIMGNAATGAAAAAFTYGSHANGGISHSGLAIPAGLATLGAALWTTAGMALWIDYGRGLAKVRARRRTVPVQPAISLSSRANLLGLQGAF